MGSVDSKGEKIFMLSNERTPIIVVCEYRQRKSKAVLNSMDNDT